MFIPQFIHLGCFWFGAITNNAAILVHTVSTFVKHT